MHDFKIVIRVRLNSKELIPYLINKDLRASKRKAHCCWGATEGGTCSFDCLHSMYNTHLCYHTYEIYCIQSPVLLMLKETGTTVTYRDQDVENGSQRQSDLL